ncbi:hypothetical protein MLD38_004271 [Melastoma candidum]|uniref:Uncharacterized protein n=1 Tax=Melastoma candidum TaxID=119954 RepID=A0ACB9S5Z9_9MYRT|nr:hypothetical protein MLD38_004271 [Melastoma candidum]
MGFREFFFPLRLIPSCFNLIANLPHDSCLPTSASPVPAAINLVMLDGHVKTYHRPVPVAELMSGFPKHLVCHSDAFYIGRKIPALSEHDLLEPGHNYFLLPSHFFQSVLTFVNIASFVASQSNCGGPAARRSFEVTRTPSGCVRVHVSDEFISRLVEEGKPSRDGEKGRHTTRLCSTPQLEKDYMRLVEGLRSGKWKPKLETIRECRKERKGRIPSAAKRRNNHDYHIEKPSSSAAATLSRTYCRIVKCH